MSQTPQPPEDLPGSNDSPAENSNSGQASTEDLRVSLPAELPPVEPPSAGMIIQLFLIPAIIVAVIVGVYALFGQLASQELDWRQLVTDVNSENPHVRWRGALGLAQMLDADKQRGEESQDLAGNEDIATALAEVYEEYIGLTELSEEELKNLEFLSKALGRMRVQAVIVPVLQDGIATDRDREVRKHSLIGLSMLAGNVREANEPLLHPELVDTLIDISREGDRLFRHQASYALGLFPSKRSLDRLEELLDDPDMMTRANAAIGLTRNDSKDGIDVFFDVLATANDWDLDPTHVKTEEQEGIYFERMLLLVNSLKGVEQLREEMTPDQIEVLSNLLKRLNEHAKDVVLKSQILEMQQQL